MGKAVVIEPVGESRSFETRYGSRVAIVGGGMLGTTLALRYRQAGRIVTLFEALEHPERRGHSSIASRDRRLVTMLDELDLAKNVRWENSSSLGPRFGSLIGGRGSIVEALLDRARAIQVDVRLATPVREVRFDGSGFVVNTDSETGEFDQVVLTVPSPIASQLMPELPDRERLALLDGACVGIITVSFLLEPRTGQRYISRVIRGRDQFTVHDPAVLSVHNDRINVMYVTRPVAATDRLFRDDDQGVIENFARAVPGNARIVQARVVRTPYAFPTTRLPFVTSSIPGLSIVNAAHMGSGRHHLERTAELATAAFRTLCAERIV